jgi:Rhodanese-like domain
MHGSFVSLAPVLMAISLLPNQSPPAQPQTAPQQKPEWPPIVIPPDTPPAVGEELRVKPDDIDALLADGKVVFLDVREPWELEENGTIEGYVNIPLGQLEKRLAELPKDKAILTA